MKKLMALFLIFAVFCCMPNPAYSKSWWKKIIERMMNEGIDRVDDSWDDDHAVMMGYDAYFLYPKSFSARYDIIDLNLYPEVKDTDVEDVETGIYGPVDFSRDASEIIYRETSPSSRKALITSKADGYKIQAQARIAVYAKRAEKIKEKVYEIVENEREYDPVRKEGKKPASWEINGGISAKKTAVMTENVALKIYMNELLALKTALTGEIALIGTVKYANMVADSLNGYIKIYDMVR